MIEDPYPPDWKALQAGVARLFNEIGLSARIEEKLKTPRGEVEIDVFAVDETSVDKIRYLVECENWNSAIPQTVVHAFNTVMAEPLKAHASQLADIAQLLIARIGLWRRLGGRNELGGNIDRYIPLFGHWAV